jgi:L-malate glycosyltransferase
MTILLITPLFPDSLDTPRTETTFAIYNFAKYWKKEHRVVVVKPKKHSWRGMPFVRDERHEMDGIEVIKIPYFRMTFLGLDLVGVMARRIARAMRRDGIAPDIVLSHYNLSIFIGARAAKALGKPFVAALHKRDIGNLERGQVRRYAASLRSADLVVSRSAPIERRLLEYLPSLPGRRFVANSGIPREEIESERLFLEKTQQIVSGRRLEIVVAASLGPFKHIDVTLRALASFRDRDWRFRILGDGPERERLETLSAELGLAGRVEFLGRRSRAEVLAAMREAEIFVMVSSRETFGLVYLEAMAKGCLVIGARGWGIDGVVVDGENGFLCEAGDAAGLLTLLDRISSSTGEELGKVALSSVRTVSALEEEVVANLYLGELLNVVEGTKSVRIDGER